jgi:predicted phosphodiesterase
MTQTLKITTTIAKDALLKFPNAAKNTLAKKIYEENPTVYKDKEHARSVLRLLTGNCGDGLRKRNYVDFRKELNALKKSLPKGESDKVEDYHLPKSIKRVLMLSDIHFPYQDDDALFSALEYGIQNQADCIWLNGDILDFYQLSRFEIDPRKRSFKYELDTCRAFIKGLRNMFPKALILYKMGNHENRYMKYLMTQAPKLLDCEEFELGVLLKFHELGIIEIKDKQLAHCADLKVLHYHELPLKSGGVNPARAVFLKTGASTIGGHYHRKSEHVERNLEGKLIKIYSTGCLCDLHPAYMPFNNWSHGFAFITINKGQYIVQNKTIIDTVVY